jgi:RNA polymerase sigma-70 factor (ECF subfamily)
MASAGADDLRRAVAGDADAFGRLYQQHAARVLRHLRSRVTNPTVAEDLAAQTFLRAWQAIGHAGPQVDRSFLAWLLTIANHLAVDHYRRSRREVYDPIALEHLVDARSPEQDVLRATLQAELGQALACLKPEQRFLIACRVVDEMAYADLARILGKSQGAVRIALMRALAVLRRELIARNVTG